MTGAPPPSPINMTLGQALQHAIELHNTGQLEQAIALYDQILASDPRHFDALQLGGLADHQRGNHARGIARMREALSITPDSAKVHNNLSIALDAIEDFDGAVHHARQALSLDPSHAGAQFNLAAALHHKGETEAAKEGYRRTLARNPKHAKAHHQLGILLREGGALEAAKPHLLFAAQHSPDRVHALEQLAATLLTLDEVGDCLKICKAWLSLDPESRNGRTMLAQALRKAKRYTAARQQYEHALAIDPDYPMALNGLAITLERLGENRLALDYMRKAAAAAPEEAGRRSSVLLMMNYDPATTGTDLLEEARRFADLVTERAKPFSSWKTPLEAKSRLRIGIVSPDLRRHPVGYHLETALRGLADQPCDIYAYSTLEDYDDHTDVLKAHFTAWRQYQGGPDQALAGRIRDDEIDILIDLAGHTGDNRLPVFAYRPAPVQASWLGYDGTTGLSAIDYVIADRWLMPAAEDAHFSERACRLPDSRLCFTLPDEAVAVGSLPALENGYVTFGSINRRAKLSPATIACWSQILQRLPTARLFLKTQEFSSEYVVDNLRAEFADHGIDADRLDFMAATKSRAAHFELHNRFDILLDPFPYPGITTTVEALWMGTPVLTLSGDRFMSRYGESILQNAGLADWVAYSEAEYVDRAVEKASDLDALAALRAGLRSRLEASPLCDAQRFGANLMAAFQDMWQERLQAERGD